MTAEPGKAVTLKMVAELAHCSISSVSTVLNQAHGNSVVSGATRKKILSVAQELGYHPNFASRSLKMQRTQTIGIYVQPRKWTSLSNNYEILIFKGIEALARERNYSVMVLNLGSDVQPDSCNTQMLEKRIDGIVLIHTDRTVAEKLVSEQRYIVAVDCAHGSSMVNLVKFDDAAAIDLAVKHLRQLGHSRIGYAGACTSDRHSSAPREAYFREALRRNGLETNETLIFNHTKCVKPISYEDRFCQAEGTAAMDYFHQLAEPPTAIVAYNSLVGAALLHEARVLGVCIPNDISLISIDDYEFLDYLEPRLTVIDHVLEDMGKAGAKMLIDLIEGHLQSPACTVLEPVLKEGTSTAPLKGKSTK